MHNYIPPKSDLSPVANTETKPQSSNKRKVNAAKSEIDFLPQSHFYHIHKEIFTALGLDVKDENLFLIRETRMEFDKESRIKMLKEDFEQRLELMKTKGIKNAALYISDPGGKFNFDDLNLFLSFLKPAYDDKKLVITKLILEGHIRAPLIFTNVFITSELECLFINKLWAVNKEAFGILSEQILQVTSNNFKLLYGPEPKPCTSSCKGCRKQPCEIAQRKKVDYKIWMKWINTLKENNIACLPCEINSEEKNIGDDNNNNNNNNNDNSNEILTIKAERKKIKTKRGSTNNNQSSTMQILSAMEPIQPTISLERQEVLNQNFTILNLQNDKLHLTTELIEKNLFIRNLQADNLAKDTIITELQASLAEAKQELQRLEAQIQIPSQHSIYDNSNFLFSQSPIPLLPDVFNFENLMDQNDSNNNNQDSVQEPYNNYTNLI